MGFCLGAQRSKIKNVLKHIKWICSKRENFRGTRCKLIQCKWKKLWQVNAYNVQILLVLIKFYPEKLELSYFSCLKQWVCKFCKKNMKIYYFKSWKTPIFGPKIDFCNFNRQTHSDHFQITFNQFYSQK